MTKTSILKDNTTLPLIVAPMFLVSNPALALAACGEGIVGSFPALNERTSEGFEKWLIQMNTSLDTMKKKDPKKKIAPYAVNLIVHDTNKRLQADLDLCVKHKVPVIITSLGINDDVIQKIHSYGGIVLHDVANVYHAKKAAQANVDGIIAVSNGAGGHAGTMNPLVLIKEIRKFYNGTLILAGGMTSGQDILTAQAMGADYAYMGTRFIGTTESNASPEYKQMLIDAQSADVIYTSAISGIPANFLRQSMEKAGFNMDEIKKQGANATKLKPINQEKADAWANVWSAGQGVGNIDDTPSAKALIARLKKEYVAAKKSLSQKTKRPKPKSP